ncbi:MAG: hypothetical protein KC643_16320 [Nitrospira sp.]|nr:hypothetical protein [Nitrospira sp.]
MKLSIIQICLLFAWMPTSLVYAGPTSKPVHLRAVELQPQRYAGQQGTISHIQLTDIRESWLQYSKGTVKTPWFTIGFIDRNSAATRLHTASDDPNLFFLQKTSIGSYLTSTHQPE